MSRVEFRVTQLPGLGMIRYNAYITLIVRGNEGTSMILSTTREYSISQSGQRGDMHGCSWLNRAIMSNIHNIMGILHNFYRYVGYFIHSMVTCVTLK